MYSDIGEGGSANSNYYPTSNSIILISNLPSNTTVHDIYQLFNGIIDTKFIDQHSAYLKLENDSLVDFAIMKYNGEIMYLNNNIDHSIISVVRISKLIEFNQ